jgi:hypothetical protein
MECQESLTGIAGNSRRDGRSASEEAFEEIGHGIGALVERAGDGGEEIPRCIKTTHRLVELTVWYELQRGAGLAWRRRDCNTSTYLR